MNYRYIVALFMSVIVAAIAGGAFAGMLFFHGGGTGFQSAIPFICLMASVIGMAAFLALGHRVQTKGREYDFVGIDSLMDHHRDVLIYQQPSDEHPAEELAGASPTGVISVHTVDAAEDIRYAAIPREIQMEIERTTRATLLAYPPVSPPEVSVFPQDPMPSGKPAIGLVTSGTNVSEVAVHGNLKPKQNDPSTGKEIDALNPRMLLESAPLRQVVSDIGTDRYILALEYCASLTNPGSSTPVLCALSPSHGLGARGTKNANGTVSFTRSDVLKMIKKARLANSANVVPHQKQYQGEGTQK